MRSRILLLLGTAATVVSAAFAVDSLRPLWLDGGGYVFQILTYGSPNLGLDPSRRLHLLIQLPLVLLVNLTEAPVSLDWPLRFFCFCYQFFPHASLLACWFLCRRRAPYLILFPLMSFAVATQLTFAFATGAVPLALSCLWPAAILVALAAGSLAEWVLFLTLAVALFYTHHFAFLAFWALAALAEVRLRTQKVAKRARGFLRFSQLVSLLLSIFLVVSTAMAHSKKWDQGFLGALAARKGLYTWILVFEGAVFVAAVLACLTPKIKHRKWLCRGFLALGALLAVARVLCPAEFDAMLDTYRARVYSIPIAAALVLALAAGRIRSTFARSESGIWEPFAYVVVLALLASAARDWRLTQTWNGWKSRLMSASASRAMELGTPCPLLPEEAGREVGAFSVPFLTLLLQPAYPVWVARTGDSALNGEEEFCRWVSTGVVPLPQIDRGGYSPNFWLGTGKWIRVEPLEKLARAKTSGEPSWKLDITSPYGSITRRSLDRSEVSLEGSSWRCRFNPKFGEAHVVCRKDGEIVEKTVKCRNARGGPVARLGDGSSTYSLSLWCLR